MQPDSSFEQVEVQAIVRMLSLEDALGGTCDDSQHRFCLQGEDVSEALQAIIAAAMGLLASGKHMRLPWLLPGLWKIVKIYERAFTI